MKGLFRKYFLFDIVSGMATTLRMMFSHPVTRQYPEEKRDSFPGFRGRHAFVRDGQTGREKCVACLKCAAICPSKCIKIRYIDREDGSRSLEEYVIEAGRCVYCGYCAEVCPVCALVLTEFYEYAAYSRCDLTFDRERLLANWDEFACGVKAGSYFNKFWRLPGLDVRNMPAAKRVQGPVLTVCRGNGIDGEIKL